MPFQIFSLILFKWIIDGRIVFLWDVNGLGHTRSNVEINTFLYNKVLR